MYPLGEAAQLLGVSRTTLWRYEHAGKIRIVRTTKRAAFVTAEELDRFIASLTASSG
jgi:excisionase family DNA binding protein